jgi:hypothetical protein
MMEAMPKRSSPKRDFMQVAREVVEHAKLTHYPQIRNIALFFSILNGCDLRKLEASCA